MKTAENKVQAIPNVIEVREEGNVIAWEDFQRSGMPDMIKAVNNCYTILAMFQTGMLAKLRSGQKCSAEDLLDDLDHDIGEKFLKYLTVSDLLETSDGAYTLSNNGNLLTADVPLARLGIYLEAYGPVIQKMGDLLSGRAVYGEDVNRDGGSLGKHCATVFTNYYTPVILKAMSNTGATRLIDLGCGAGRMLIDACLQDPAVTGIGIDISPAAIEVARETASTLGLGDRLQFLVADAFDPASWPVECYAADSLSAVGVLHEALRDGELAVARKLDGYAALLPKLKTLLIGEPELRYDNRENDSDFFLIHLLTGQGIPRDRHGWMRVFEKTGLECRRIFTPSTAGPRTCFYDLAPKHALSGQEE
jgi:SAM-dependent methyltransferase